MKIGCANKIQQRYMTETIASHLRRNQAYHGDLRLEALQVMKIMDPSCPSCFAQENQCALQAQNNLAVLYEECQQPLEWDCLCWVCELTSCPWVLIIKQTHKAALNAEVPGGREVAHRGL